MKLNTKLIITFILFFTVPTLLEVGSYLVLRYGFGFMIVAISICTAFYYLIRYFCVGYAVDGFATLVISLWLLSGIIIMLIGMTGIYIGKIFDKVKERPLFIVNQMINFDDSTVN